MGKRVRKRSKKARGKYFQVGENIQEMIDGVSQKSSEEIKSIAKQFRKGGEVLVDLLKAREDFQQADGQTSKEGAQDEIEASSNSSSS